MTTATATVKTAKTAKSTKAAKPARKVNLKPTAPKTAKPTVELSYRPAVTGFIAKEAKSNRADVDPANVREGSKTAIALDILRKSAAPLSPAEIVEKFAGRGKKLKWPVGMLRNMERMGLISKLKAANGRVVFQISSRGRETAKAL